MTVVTPLHPDPERRRRLLATKLRALLRTGWPEETPAEPAAGGGGVAVDAGGRGWVLLDNHDVEPLHGFARALLWGLPRGVEELHVLADDHPDLAAAARQAVCFKVTVAVWAVHSTSLRAVEPVPLPDEPPLDPQAARFRDVIAAGGAEPVIEWGQLTGEVLGMPVARVCSDDAGAWLEVGVGKHDRLGNRMVWGDEPPPRRSPPSSARCWRPAGPAIPPTRSTSSAASDGCGRCFTATRPWPALRTSTPWLRPARSAI